MTPTNIDKTSYCDNFMDISDQEVISEESSDTDDNVNDNNDDSTLLINSTACKNASPADLSSSKTHEEITPNGKIYRCANNTIIYSTSNIDRVHNQSLADRGANRGVAGEDTRVISCDPHRNVDVRGIDNHEITSIPIVSAGGVTTTLQGEIIIIMHQCAYCGKGKTIHSSGKLEWFKNNDKSIKVGGFQRILINNGYLIPINIKNNHLTSKDTMLVSGYNNMILSNSSERDNMILTYSNDRVTSNVFMRDKILMLDRDTKIELILSDHSGEVRIVVVDEFSNVSFVSHNIFGVNYLCNSGYVLKEYHNDNSILTFDNTKEKWGDKTSCNLVSSFNLLTLIDSYDSRLVSSLRKVDMSRLVLSLLILFKNEELELDISFLTIREFMLLGNIICNLIFLASFIMNNINNIDKISNNLINDNALFAFINNEKSQLDNASENFNEWGVMSDRRIILNNYNYPSFYLDYFDFCERKDNKNKDLLSALLLPTESHYLSRESATVNEVEMCSVVDNNFISNIVEDIILDVINNNNNSFSDPNVSDLVDDDEDGEHEVKILSLPVTYSETLLPVPPEPPPYCVIKNHN